VNQWDPHPAFTNMFAYRPNADQAYIDAANQRMRDLYEQYARRLDVDYPMWHYEILTVNQPPHELVELAQERRDREERP
jgi:hypothetical protein